MEPPALHRSALVRALFAIVLTCVLVTQPLFGGGLSAFAEPSEPKVRVSIERVSPEKVLSGAEAQYRVTVNCSVLATEETEKCLGNPTVVIDGIPRNWEWRVGENPNVLDTSRSPRTEVKVGEIGRAGGNLTFDLFVTPPNYTTPNGTEWKLSATVFSDTEEKAKSDSVRTVAEAEANLNLTKESSQKSTWVGDTFHWWIRSDDRRADGKKEGVYRSIRVEYVDTLPEGFEFVKVTNLSGDNLNESEYDYNPDTHELKIRSDAHRDFKVHTKVQPGVPQGEHENKVTATSYFPENGRYQAPITKTATAKVSVAGHPEGHGEISKSSIGMFFHDDSGRGTRAIYRRSYKDARDSDWDGLSITTSPDYFGYSNNPDKQTQDSRRMFIAGAYQIHVWPKQGGTSLKPESNLFPLKQTIVDDVPCMDSGFVEDGFLFKSRTDGKLCQSPAFHVTAVQLRTHTPGPDPEAGELKPIAVLTNGDKVPLDILGTNDYASGTDNRFVIYVFSVPNSARGKVARIIAPDKASGRYDAWDMAVGGFPEETLPGNAILRNEKANVKVWASGETEPFIDAATGPADLHLVGSLHDVKKTNEVRSNALKPAATSNDNSGSTIEAGTNAVLWETAFIYDGKKQPSGDIIVSDLLPRGMEVVTNPEDVLTDDDLRKRVAERDQVEFSWGVSGDKKRQVQTTVQENFKDGRTLIQWRIPHEWANPDRTGNVEFKGKVRIVARPQFFGDYTNEAYVTDATEPEWRCLDRSVDDSFDIDNDPKTKKACYSTSTAEVKPPANYLALTLTKAVKGPKEDSFAYSPKKAVVAGGDDDGDVTYRVEAVNSSGEPMKRVVFYDVLPHAGDTGVSSDLSDQSRGSTKSGSFTKMTKVPDGVKVFYSTSTNPCRPEVFPDDENKGCDNKWSETAPDDLSTVQALKFVYEGELAPGKSLTADYTMSVPVMGPKDVLWNSVAAKASFGSGKSLPAVEAPKVGAARVAEPAFAVKKEPGKASAENGKWTSSYTVTVTNTGPFEGEVPRVTDTPVLPEGFEFKQVLVDGADTNYKNGAFPVTQGEKLAPGASKSFTVVISGDYKAADVDWASVAKCETAGGGSVTGGLVNTVTMDGDTDGTENNTACNPVKKDPKFAVKKAASGEASAVNGTWSSTYKVTVSNTGEVKGTSKAVADTPSVPAGFTLSGAKVDGKDAELTDGSFTVTDGVELAPGESKSFTVVVSGSFDPARVKESEVLHCTGEEGVSDGKGFANGVTMKGDSDGSKNNTACTTVEKTPKFAVKKEASGKANAVNGKWSSTYKVTVTNTGVLAGKSPVVTDKPAAPKGFLVTSARIDKGQPVTLTNGEFTVSDGVELAPGESKSFTVVVLGTFVPGQADGAAASQCDAAVQDASKGGFFNQVTMKGDSDGSKNNTACTTVEKAPKFAVKKEASGEASAVNGQWSSTYKVTVSNTGVLAGKSAAVVDTPSAPAGFQVENVSVDGADSTLKDGSFTVTNGVELAPGESKSFTVVVSGTFVPGQADGAAASQCDAAVQDASKGGFFNQVTMKGDSDGSKNNTACTTVEKAPKFAVKKEASGEASAVNGKWSSTYTVTVTNTGVLAGKSAAVVDTPSVPAGFSLTNATVEGADVALADGSFTVTDGVELAPGESKSFTVVVSGSFDPARVKESEVLQCAGDGAEGAHGFVNDVTLDGDSDGEGNNTACTTVEKTPKFAVKKEASGKANAVNGQWSSTYTVTVTNTGVLAGKSAAVVDTPSVPAGFQVEKATVQQEDAGEATEVAFEDGSFTVTDGVELAPGDSRSFTVVVSGSYRPADVDWTAAGQCGADGAEGAHGFVNTVAMPGDTDGEDNNTACTTVEKDPAFAVKKESGKASAVNGEWSSTYTVTVTNTGERAGKSKPVVDTPRVPAGFTVTGATVDGKRVAVKDGSFTVTDGVELGLGGAKSFTVVVSGSYSANADWAKASRCDADGATSGLFNQVSMPGDSDGAANNTACNMVEKPKTPVVPQKPSKPQKPVSGLPLPRTGAPIGLSAAAGVFTVLAGCVILVAGRRSRRS